VTLPTPVGGTCDERFAGVREAFAANLATGGEHGGAVCVSVDGRVVVDLWGGHADEARRQRWGPDTLVNAFSVGKGLIALLAARLVGQGRLELDAPVVGRWPEFGGAGKETVTVRHLLSHQAGLPALRDRLPPGAMFDWDLMTSVLAAESPWWEPGTGHGYHVNTFGFLVGEVLARVTGHSPGELLAREVAGPLGADVHIGVPARDEARVAELLGFAEAPDETPPPVEGLQLMRYNAYFNPSGLSGAGVINTRAWRAAEIPSANAHASARGVTRVYSALAAGGTIDGVTVVDRDALATATTEQVAGPDLVLERGSRFGLGFQLTQLDRPLGPNPTSFGHFGAGGSLGFCDPVAGVAFGYVTNQLGPRWQNPRNRALMDSVYEALA
jgi:CubicO group peptidase (beta-lactamase class C family)